MKPILLIPMAGRGQRFVDQNFKMPKPLVKVDDKCILDYSFLSIKDVEQYELIFLVRSDHCNTFGIDDILKKKFNNPRIIKVDTITQGSVSTCLLAEEFIDNYRPLTIFTLDVFFDPKFDFRNIDDSLDGLIVTFKSNNNGYSYAEVKDGLVSRTAEKDVISEDAAAGVYFFKRGHDFVGFAKQMIKEEIKTKGEYFISPLYNLLIESGLRIGVSRLHKMHVLGTPEELKFFQTNVNKTFGQKPIALCCDHSGYDLKNQAIEVFQELGIKYIDFGVLVKRDCDYIDYVNQAVDFIQNGTCDFGFGFCRTGQGVNIAANKRKGIRSSLIYDGFSAEMAVRHNASNFFCLSERSVDKESLRLFIDLIKANSFDGGRFSDRILKLE